MSYYTGRWLNKTDITQTFTGPLSAYIQYSYTTKNKIKLMTLLDRESSSYSNLRYDMIFLCADELFNLFNGFGVPN